VTDDRRERRTYLYVESAGRYGDRSKVKEDGKEMKRGTPQWITVRGEEEQREEEQRENGIIRGRTEAGWSKRRPYRGRVEQEEALQRQGGARGGRTEAGWS